MKNFLLTHGLSRGMTVQPAVIKEGHYENNFFQKIKAYPNPAAGTLPIDGLPENKKAEITLYDMNSRLIKEFTTYSSFTELDISDVVPGSYLLVINNQLERTVKIIKE